MIEKLTERQQQFNGEIYWLCGMYFQRYGKRLHRAVWEHYNGPVPKGMHVHHVDHDRSNNDISNLDCVDRHHHLSHHSKIVTPKMLAAKRENIKKAHVWHSTPAGRAWHSEHGRKQNHRPHTATCTICRRDFPAAKPTTLHCSNACGQQAHRNRLKERV